MTDDLLSSPDDSSLSILSSEDDADRHERKASLVWAVRAGLLDLRRSRVLAVATALTAFMAALAVMSAPLMGQLVSAGEAHVTHISELIVFIDDVSAEETEQAVKEIARIQGVEGIEESTNDDLAALPPSVMLSASQGRPYTLHPDGFVPLDAIEAQLRQIAHVRSSALALGIHSMAAIRLAAQIVPWFAGVLAVFGLIMVANLAFMSARIRSSEAAAMSMVGGDALTVWISTATVIVVPTFIVVLGASVGVIALAPWIASIALPAEAAGQVARTGLIPVGLMLISGSAALAVGLSYFGLQTQRSASD